MTEEEIDNKILELYEHEESISRSTSNVLIYTTLLCLSTSLSIITFDHAFDNSETVNTVMYGMLGAGNAGLATFEVQKIREHLKNRKLSMQKFVEVLEELDNETGRKR